MRRRDVEIAHRHGDARCSRRCPRHWWRPRGTASPLSEAQSRRGGVVSGRGAGAGGHVGPIAGRSWRGVSATAAWARAGRTTVTEKLAVSAGANQHGARLHRRSPGSALCCSTLMRVAGPVTQGGAARRRAACSRRARESARPGQRPWRRNRGARSRVATATPVPNGQRVGFVLEGMRDDAPGCAAVVAALPVDDGAIGCRRCGDIADAKVRLLMRSAARKHCVEIRAAGLRRRRAARACDARSMSG